MINTKSIKTRIVIGTLLSCLVPLIIGSIFISRQLNQAVYEDNIEDSHLILEQIAGHVDDSLIEQSKSVIRILENDKKLIASGDNLNTYMDYSDGIQSSGISNEERELLDLFKSIKESMPYLTMVSYGNEFGGYVEYPDFKPTSSYDPRIRPWYIGAIQSSDIVISEPYETMMTKELVLSVDSAVKSEGKPLGVLSLTIRVDDILNFIEDISIGKTGEIVVISNEGYFINSPEHPEWLLKSVNEISTNAYKLAIENQKREIEYKIAGREKLLTIYQSKTTGWYFITVIDKAEVLSQSMQVLKNMLMAILATVIVMSLILLVALSRITEPIGRITEAIIQLSKFDFNSQENFDWSPFKSSHDEIGKIASAMSRFEEGFVELRQSLKMMNKEIQEIEVNKGPVDKLVLADKNPFNGIAESVNALLEKVNDYVSQIKNYTLEITDKNELLVASEEELSAQLEEIMEQKQQIQFMAEQDPLTTLPNRRQFSAYAEKLTSMNIPYAVLMLDIDNFKDINDSLGHIFGDRILMEFAMILNEYASDAVFISRFGGDEFLILYKTELAVETVEAFVEALFKRFDSSLKIGQHEIRIKFSIGISTDSADIETCIRYSDLALYHVKSHGKQSHAFFDKSMEAHMNRRLEVNKALKSAIENDGFYVLYQPQVCLKTGDTIGYEALLRMKEHTYPASLFIDVAEKEGLIIEIGRIVVDKVLRQINKWHDAGADIKPISINYSAGQLMDYGFVTYLMKQLNEYHIQAEHLVIEITESVFIENMEEALDVFNRISELGIKISIDDFGTKYSSLNYLKIFPASTLKFDRHLCQHLIESFDIKAIQKLVDFIHELGLQVIAEGIEETEHVTKFINAGCDCIQGYYFSKPIEPEALLKIGKGKFKLPNADRQFE